jgi:hypothetical protein
MLMSWALDEDALVGSLRENIRDRQVFKFLGTLCTAAVLRDAVCEPYPWSCCCGGSPNDGLLSVALQCSVFDIPSLRRFADF